MPAAPDASDVPVAATAGRGGQWRMLAATFALALLYVIVSEALLDLGGPLGGSYLEHIMSSKLDDETARVADASAAREAGLTPAHRLAAWQLGLVMGYTSRFLSNFAQSPPLLQQRARAAVAPRLAGAQRLADFLQVDAPLVLESGNVYEATTLRTRIESDDFLMSRRIAERLGPRMQHLFLLGMQVGVQVAEFDQVAGMALRDPNELEVPVPPRLEIQRHATLAGLSRAQWEPLAEVPAGRRRQMVAQAYRGVVSAMDPAILALALPRQEGQARK
jgi:hypothetical protein